MNYSKGSAQKNLRSTRLILQDDVSNLKERLPRLPSSRDINNTHPRGCADVVARHTLASLALPPLVNEIKNKQTLCPLSNGREDPG